jgi:UDP-N-acetylmuramoyl-L-alanyl-D-glutamate--2,6-diaminopimelate ligase
MRLETLLEFADMKGSATGWEEVRSLEIGGICYDSRRANPGDLFVAIAGDNSDGHEHLEDAARAGAIAALVERSVEGPFPQITVESTRWSLGPLSAAFHGNPAERLLMVGVTGTNGKTTTTHLIRRLLERSGESAGMIGTVTYAVGGREQDAVHTTPESADLQTLLTRMLDAGDSSAVVEVSSHALALGRVEGLAFDVACFTNLGRDHLDFHGSTENYLEAKRTLFSRYLKPDAVAVFNLDDQAGEELSRSVTAEQITVSMSGDADVTATDVEVAPDGLRFVLAYGGEEAGVESPLLGLFNVQNLLISAAVGKAAGLNVAEAADALGSIDSVPGRMERLEGPPGVNILLDYAHKPEALRGALQACRDLTAHHVIVVFGCGGDRDRGKRPLMGRIAALGADFVIVTSDNPRSEDPDAIIDEIVVGIPPEASFSVQRDRRAAIAEAIEMAVEGDVVLVAGKGHEQYQLIGSARLPFDEREAVAEAVAALAGEVAS